MDSIDIMPLKTVTTKSAKAAVKPTKSTVKPNKSAPKTTSKSAPKAAPKTTSKAAPKAAPKPTTAAKFAKASKAAPNPVKKIKKTIEKETTQVKKSHRFHPGTVALRDIRKYQKSQKLLMARLPFGRLVRKVAQEYSNENHLDMPKIQFQYNALVGLQEATEDFAVKLFEAANTTALHANRITVQTKDLKLAQELRK